MPLQRLVDFMGWQQRKTVSAYASVRGTIVLFCDVRQVQKLPNKGKFIDENGCFLGWHEGYPFYTIGQRRGLGIQMNRAVFVKEISVERNEVVLAPLASLYNRRCG